MARSPWPYSQTRIALGLMQSASTKLIRCGERAMDDDLIKRFRSKYIIVPEAGCWLWEGACTPEGYGTLSFKNKTVSAHRLSYAIHNEHPGEMCVCHRCDTPMCVNPNHLFLGTHKDNARDKIKKGRGCIGEDHGSAKLSVREVRAIKSATGSQRAIAKRSGISQSNVSFIKLGLRHLQS